MGIIEWAVDTIVPDPASPQSWNRYSYVVNNPLRFYDPTGHFELGSDEEGYNQDSEVYQYYMNLGWSDEDIFDLFRIWEYQYSDWWNLLLEAEIGDYLDYIDYGGSNLYAHFGTDGNGELQIQISWDMNDAWSTDTRLDQVFFGYWDYYYEDMGMDWSIDALRIWNGSTATNILLTRQGYRGSGSGFGFIRGTGVFRDSDNLMPTKMNLGGALKQTWGWFAAAGAAFASPADGPVGELVLSGAGVVDAAHALYENYRDRSRLSQYAYPRH